jgi:hypothetical protein
MRLSAATPNDVVKNARNGSFYRYEGPINGRARIYPMELFPNGRLMPKPTPTNVDADLEVQLVGQWREGMAVEGRPKHGRKHYEDELAEAVEYLAFLEVEYEGLPASGTGKLSRGSWANKLKNTRGRIETLRAGLAAPDGSVEIERADDLPALPDLSRMDVVLLPSGRAGLVLDFSQVGASHYATVRTRCVTGGDLLSMPVPCEVLRPWRDAHLCTV